MKIDKNLFLSILMLAIFIFTLFFVSSKLTIVISPNVTYGSTDVNVTQQNEFAHLNLTDGSLVYYNPFDFTPGGNWTQGVFGNARGFDGTDDFVNLSNSDFSYDVITVSLWVKPEDLTKRQDIIASGASQSFGVNNWIFSLSAGGTQGQITVFGDSTSFSSAGFLVNTGEWQNIAFTNNGSFTSLYYNGVLQTSGAHTINNDNTYFSGIGMSRRSDTGVAVAPFTGSIDEVLIFNRSLNSTEIAELNNTFAINNKTGLVSHWSFNQSNGFTVIDNYGGNYGKVMGAGTETTYDYTNFSNDGTINGNALQTYSRGYYGGAYEFDGVDDYVSIPYISTHDELTYSFWINVSSTNTQNALLSMKTLVRINGATQVQYFPDIDTTVLTASGLSLLNDWHHIAVTHDSSNNYVIYVDGVSEASGTTVNIDSGVAPGLGSRIGGYTPGFVDGSMDEVMIFNRSLSPTEIEQIYNSTYERFLPSGTMNFTGLDFGNNNTVDITIPECQQLNGSQLSFSLNGGSFSSLNSSCMFQEYSLLGDSSNSFLTLRLESNTDDFYSPLVVGNITLNDYSTNGTGPQPTPSNASANNRFAYNLLENINADSLGGHLASFFMPLNNSVFGQFDFNGGWLNGGLSIIEGAIYAQEAFFYNVTSLNITHQNLTINDNLIVQGNITLANGGKVWDNATCTFISSPDGSVIQEICNA